MKTKDIRKKYLDFFKARDHAIIPCASIIPENDPTTLFTSSGMQPLVPYLMGEKHPAGKRLANIQKSLRVDDIEEVGDNRHTTCFEMLGNWSLGDYFKKEQLNWFFDFLTKELGIDPARLYVTVFRGNESIGVEKDSASVKIWQEIFAKKGIKAKDIDLSEREGMQDGRIFYYDESKNWWSRSGAPANMPIGEIGGPDSEVFYDMGADLKRHENSRWAGSPCHLNCDCGRFIEIGNSVFIEFIKTRKGFEKLSQQNVDFGGGLERIAMILQKKDNIFETDLYAPVLNKIEEFCGKKYRENMKAFEIIADHLKGACMIMGDNKKIPPSNTDQGYIIRRLIRRAIRFGKILGIAERNWTKKIAEIIVAIYFAEYNELKKNIDFIKEEMEKEEAKFAKTLKKGEKMIRGEKISGEDAFNLFQTYGYPVEMTEEIAKENNIKLSNNFKNEYKTAMENHQALSRTASAGKFKGGLADMSEETTRLHSAAHLLLAALRQVLGDHVQQRGSNITAERLRFDFSHPTKLTDEEKDKIEKLVNQAISEKLPVKCEEMTVAEAKKSGAQGVFESKYEEKVKVFVIGGNNNVFSREICGGPHVENTADLGNFKIKKEQSSSAGVRRIKAVLQ